MHSQIYEEFRERIVQGYLSAGNRVPSTRELARDLRISRLPILDAYAQLLAEGYFEARAGSGTYVASSLQPNTGQSIIRKTEPRTNRRVSFRTRHLPKYQRPTWAENLGPFQVGQPELREFPVSTWSRLVGRYARSIRIKDLQYGHPFGMQELRNTIAAYLRTSRAVRCTADQIVVTSGSQQALDLAVRVLLNPGDQAWCEEPGYWLAKQVLMAGGSRIVPVLVDEEGLQVELGMKLARTARAAFVSPSHQYPLGVTMSAARRLKLLEWADAAQAWIIEDDYDSEFRYDSVPIASLQGLDRNDRVIYIGNFSKAMFPAMRLGYMVIPADLIESFAAVRQTMDICPALMNQAAVVDFIREGHFARHIRRMRPIYARRRRVLTNELVRQLNSRCRIMGSAAGMHLALVTRTWVDDEGIASRAAKRSLWLSPLSASYLGRSAQTGFVLGYGNTKVSQIPEAVEKLKDLLH